MKGTGLDLLEEFLFAHRTTFIRTCAAEWMHEDTMSVVFDVLEGGDKRRQCEQCGQPSPCTFQGEKVWQMPRGIILLQRVSATSEWKEHKPQCDLKPGTGTNLRSVANIMGLEVGSFAEEEACSWLKANVQ